MAAVGLPAASPFRRGLLDMLPLLVGLVPFALLLGALAAGKGLSPLETALMSALVFAGASQFIAVDLWREPAPVLLLAGMTLLVNARHLLMGAAFARHLGPLPAGRFYPALFLMADETWAMALASGRRGPEGLAYFAGLGLGLWLNWVFWTTAGALVGATLRDPAAYGLDFAFVAVFLVLLRGLWRGRPSLVPWLASATVAALVARALPGPWYVPLGAVAGLLAAALLPPPAADA